MKLKDFSFRLWNNQEKHYIINNPCLVEFNHNPGEIKAGLLLGEYGNYDFIENYDDEIEIEPWTGLYDKNRKKIYEGDILYSLEDCDEDEAFKYKVVFKEGAFYLVAIDDEFDEDLMSEFALMELEVIGNIYENKELLK